MRHIESNPTWTQPTSIVKNETIPHLKKDSAYLEKNHLVLLDYKGNPVSTSPFVLKNLSANRFPYIVRHERGPWNALGDTPSKSHFSRSSKAYSHGCIRVNKPKDLAALLLEGTG